MQSVIKSYKTKILIEGDPDLIEKIQQSNFAESYIPDFHICDSLKDQQSIHKIEIKKSSKTVFKVNQKGWTLECQCPEKTTIQDIITVIDYCLDFIRQQDGYYCIHGSGVISPKGEGILFIGSVSGLGKTTLSLNLSLNHGYTFVGDDKIIITKDGLLASGSKRILYNKESLTKSIKENLDNLSLEDLKRKIKIQEKPFPLKYIIQPQIISEAKTSIEEWSVQKTEFHLYEEMSRKIRGISRRINNFTIPLQSIDHDIISYNRSISAKRISIQTKAFTLRGNLSESMDLIHNLNG